MHSWSIPSLASLEAVLPQRLKQLGRQSFLHVAALTNAGSIVQCPCCERRFRKLARFEHANEQCPGCGSLMRHRALRLYLEDVFEIGSTDCRVLHVAPEPALAGWLASHDRVDYVSVDRSSAAAEIRADITALPFADEAFDLLVCLHVLEHVSDDGSAIAELYRVLRRGGRAIVQVPPSSRLETFEDATARSPGARRQRFGQYDHVRICGADYDRRLVAAGFDVRTEDYVTRLPPGVRALFGLRAGEPFYVCTKP